MSRVTSSLIGLLLGITMLRVANAENWPGWRGPRGDGTSLEQDVPLEWDAETGKNVVWKTELPGQGHSSPIVWNDRLFLTTCIEQDEQRLLLCFDTNSGHELWRREVFQAPLESTHRLNSFASGTPVTDGELVYVAFLKVDGSTIPAPNVGAPRDITAGRIILSAFDFAGNRRWQEDVGDFISAHGFCSSPVLYRELIILNGDHDGRGYLVAVNRATGEEVWRTDREQGIRSYVTPIIRTIDGQDQLVLSGSGHVASFDPASGRMIWKVDGPTEQFVASMVFDGERFLMAAGFPTHHVMAIRPTGSGNVSQTHVAWRVDDHVRCYVPSPVVLGSYLFVADDGGTAQCLDSRSGMRLWRNRISGGINASLVATQKLVYILATDGRMTIVDPSSDFEVVAENRLGEYCCTSPAISQGQFYIRGQRHLFCIGNRAAPPPASPQ